LAVALSVIQSPNPRRRPAAVRTTKGESLPRVIFVTDDEVLRWHLPVWKRLVRAGEVETILPSPDQIPSQLAKVLWETWETSMGSLEFLVTMRDGKKLAFVYSGPSDFVTLPASYRPSDIVEIRPGRGLAAAYEGNVGEPDNAWCVYSP